MLNIVHFFKEENSTSANFRGYTLLPSIKECMTLVNYFFLFITLHNNSYIRALTRMYSIINLEKPNYFITKVLVLNLVEVIQTLYYI
jgi:hypothetical protein